jgi:hypothetical protein
VDHVAGRDDARLTIERGQACTRAARQAAERAVAQWRSEVGPGDYRSFELALMTLVAPISSYRPLL